MTVAVSLAVERGAKAIMCASTGNTSASAAAYAARAGIKCIVLIPNDAVAMGKLSQALVHGATVIAIRGNFDDALTLARRITEKYPVALVNSLNPDRIEGQKTAAFEIVDALGRAPDYQTMPVGNAGNITAYWKGYREYYAQGKARALPRVLGFQAAGSAPIVEGHPIENPETVATAIRIGNPARWQEAVEATESSGGLMRKVEDSKILRAYRLLASTEGVFVEPASAVSIAGLIELDQDGYFDSAAGSGDEKPTVVSILTGHGLKDPERAVKECPKPTLLPPDEKEIVEAVGLSRSANK